MRVCGGAKSGSACYLHCLSLSRLFSTEFTGSLFLTGLSLSVSIDHYWSAATHVAIVKECSGGGIS